jgi:hypothetical protein
MGLAATGSISPAALGITRERDFAAFDHPTRWAGFTLFGRA